MEKIRKKSQALDWWEISYLFIYGTILTYEFLNTTMFQIQWPPRFGYLFLGSSALYTVAKLVFHNTYTKKELLLSGVILISFVVPAVLTDYSFLFWIGFLIVGAKGIDFKKIIKLYLVISVTIMIIAFTASQIGVIEDLIYVIDRGNKIQYRHSFGIIYPTDFAAHLFYIVVAAVIFFKDKVAIFWKVLLCILVAVTVYVLSNAKTTTLCLIGFAVLCIIEAIYKRHMVYIEKIFRWAPIIFASGFLYLAYCFDETNRVMNALNNLLSRRLELSKIALDDYPIKFFGQTVYEVGYGVTTEDRVYYFFIDDSYVRILIEYGVALFIITLVMMVIISARAGKNNQYLLVLAVVAIAVHSIMEHHLIEIAYNPTLLALFATLQEKEQINRRKRCIEETVKVG